ncbi:thioesterase family protein [Pannus brasiliensis CCIBt3594]|uniref:1,4-dihydroxy-2-naphthoyl-CoA hydrolase n=1 Tax=Pannus brasiliensis CCIBt3594 TaxID=1427578 RepID=A0AAW9QKW0_9CHRO
MIYTRSIRLADTDAAGVIYFANLLSICHEAYEESLARSGIFLRDFLDDSPIAIPIAKAEIQFFHPLFCGDRLRVQIHPISIADTEFELEYTIFLGENTEKAVGKARTRHVCIDRYSRQRIVLPNPLQNWLKSL